MDRPDFKLPGGLNVPEPPWNPHDNTISFANYNRLYLNGFYTAPRWNYYARGINLDDQDYREGSAIVTGGSALYNEFQFHWREQFNQDQNLGERVMIFTYGRSIPSDNTRFGWYLTSSASRVGSCGTSASIHSDGCGKSEYRGNAVQRRLHRRGQRGYGSAFVLEPGRCV